MVSVIDDGLETDHKELKANYDSEASFNVFKNISNPYPRSEQINQLISEIIINIS